MTVGNSFKVFERSPGISSNIMKPFLQRLAEEIAARFGDDPGQVCVVLPNRRAGLYLKKYLALELKKKPIRYHHCVKEAREKVID